MKESTGALIWISVIIGIVICLGLTIRNVKEGLHDIASDRPTSNTTQSGKTLAQESADEQNRALQESKRQLLENQRQLREAQKQVRDSQRDMRSN